MVMHKPRMHTFMTSLSKNGFPWMAHRLGGVTPEPTPTPILEGTWVLNERLSAPEKDFDEINLYFTFGTKRCSRIRTSNRTHLSAYKVISGDGINIYQFNTNTWKSTNRNLTFETGATSSDEFRAWLASNATKQ